MAGSRNTTSRFLTFLIDSQKYMFDAVTTYTNADRTHPLKSVSVFEELPTLDELDQVQHQAVPIHHIKKVMVEYGPHSLRRKDDTLRQKTSVCLDQVCKEIPWVNNHDQCKEVTHFFKSSGFHDETTLNLMCTVSVGDELDKISKLAPMK